MSTKFKWTASLALGALSLASMVGCVADRPARNGVFNENQYVRKDFLIRPGDGSSADNGWYLKATITEASEPNVYGDDFFALFAGSHSQGDLMHFVVTSDKLQMVSNREISSVPSAGTEPEVINAWPVTNVDLKYRVNLDGETTNFYEENQELDWQVRQWVKVSFDKNDLSDLAPLGAFAIQNIENCTDQLNLSVTLVPNSFLVDETHDYMEWSVQVTLPIIWSTSALAAGGTITNCYEAYGPMGNAALAIGRQNETVTLKYSMTRAVPQPTYQPLIVAEKDPIQRKYGPLTYIGWNRDPNTTLLAANAYVTRFDPKKPIDWYFEEGFPTAYMPYFTKNPAELPAGVRPLPSITTIEDGTNALLAASGAAARVAFHQYNEPMSDGSAINRAFGDVRWNMLRWMESVDQQSFFAGVTQFNVDPRSGETLNADIVFENFGIKDIYVTQLDAYMQSLGLSPGGSSPFDQTPWSNTVEADGVTPLPACTAASAAAGLTVPIIPATVRAAHNGNSTLFQKIQQYLYKPTSAYGPLGPTDFIAQHLTPGGAPDTDFYNAYYSYIPYIIFADPAMNQYVIPESGFANVATGGSAQMWSAINQEGALHQLESQLDHGQAPFNVNASTGEADARSFLDTYKAMTLNHRALDYTKKSLSFMPGNPRSLARGDTPDAFSMLSVVQKDARHCVAVAEAPGAPTTPHWESKAEWINSLMNSYWSQVFWHEFGHAMGLDHNFMASVDKPNFPASNGTNSDGTTRYPLYSSSVMEYNARPDRIFWNTGWAPYDKGAISWIYANVNGNPANVPVSPGGTPVAKGASGQINAKYPWIDPNGFATNGNELQFLFCNASHERYTPLCREGDMGTTPSEIVANEIENYDWQFQFTNFRKYHKFWDDSNYGDTPMTFITELRRFLSLWAYDMSSGELTQRFQQIGVVPPTTAVEAQTYYDQLTKSFDDEMSAAASLAAATHEAIVQQSAGARPYLTTFDNYFGDVTQQGIILDKVDAIQSFTALWPVDNYDQTQAQGQYISSYAGFGVSFYADETSIGSLYQTVAEQAVTSMLGGSFDAFEYAKPLAVAQFNFDTHDPNYLYENAAPARPEAMEWAGGYQFYRLQDFLTFFQNIAVQQNFNVVTEAGTVINCTSLATCNYDPRTPQGYPQDQFYSNTYNQFLGPDGRRWIWAYLQDRNQYVACDQDRNIATYVQMLTYTTDVVFGQDDGNVGPAFADEVNINYTLDYYSESLQQTPQ